MYTLNLHNVIYQLYLNKARKPKRKQEGSQCREGVCGMVDWKPDDNISQPSSRSEVLLYTMNLCGLVTCVDQQNVEEETFWAFWSMGPEKILKLLSLLHWNSTLRLSCKETCSNLLEFCHIEQNQGAPADSNVNCWTVEWGHLDLPAQMIFQLNAPLWMSPDNAIRGVTRPNHRIMMRNKSVVANLTGLKP